MKSPERRGRTLGNGRCASSSPVVNKIRLWGIRRSNGCDRKVGVFEGRVAQTEAKLITGGDVLLTTI